MLNTESAFFSVAGQAGFGFDLRMGLGKRRSWRRWLQLWRLYKQHIHSEYKQCNRNGQVPWYSEACSSTLATTYSSGSTTERQIVRPLWKSFYLNSYYLLSLLNLQFNTKFTKIQPLDFIFLWYCVFMHRRSHHTGCTGPNPTNFWESNMGPAQYCAAKY